jgi:hypothetical protein
MDSGFDASRRSGMTNRKSLRYASLLGRAFQDQRSGRVQKIHRPRACDHCQIWRQGLGPRRPISDHGPHKFQRFVVIEFPSFEQGVACFTSKEYDEAAAFRRTGAGEVETIMVDGGDATT